MKLKRNRDNATDNGLYSKRFKCNNKNLGFYNENSNGADIGSAGGLNDFKTAKIRKPDADKSVI